MATSRYLSTLLYCAIGVTISISSLPLVYSWAPIVVTRSSSTSRQQQLYRTTSSLSSLVSLHAVKEPETKSSSSSSPTNEIEETTEAYGLEAGLFQSLKQNDGGQSAKSLLAKYGVAYLATSIPLAIVSFTICYFLVDSGVDVSALLSNVGIQVGDSADKVEKVGTFAIAYAAHKAASPIRFPPTVLLTPIVAKMIGKEPEELELEN